jgi:peptidoglycan/LPS O-acetylase OafA/YrhL
MTRRNGSLDALRAAAIGMVLACHLTNTFLPGTGVASVAAVGGRGVDLFFVLSGWLLGSQLFREAERTGTIDVRRFWVRRWLRTLPAYHAMLLATFGQIVVQGRADRIDWRYLLFVQNYLPDMPYLGVTWSLCVEEHFYLAVAPAVWLAFRRRWGVWLVAVIASGLVAAHVAGWYPTHNTYEIYASHVRWEQCAAGVVLAWVAARRPRAWAWLVRRSLPLAGLATVLIVVAVLNATLWGWWLPGWGTFGWGLIFAAWVLRAVVRERAVPAWIEFVATRAYAIYLVHVEAIAAVRHLGEMPAGVRMVLALGLAFALAEVLYRCVERPFMRLRERLPTARTRNVSDGVRDRHPVTS